MAQAPHWAPDAVATEKGWVDPNSGELLVAVEGLLAEETPKKRTRKATTTVEETPVEEAPQATE